MDARSWAEELIYTFAPGVFRGPPEVSIQFHYDSIGVFRSPLVEEFDLKLRDALEEALS